MLKEILLNKFINYVKIDTMSMEGTNTTPSTNKQFQLANILVEELRQLGLEQINISENCFVTAVLPSNVENNNLSIGFIAHMDTIPGFSGTNVNPKVISNYDGEDIFLSNIKLSPNQFPSLKNLLGKTLITTDGTTVLGADDKAGIAIIMSMLHFYHTSNAPHVEIKVAFTPDEEIGEGIEHFDLSTFVCDFAYTVDGGAYNEINFENFNAASATVTIRGLDIHPGEAKHQMINASEIAMEFHKMLPEQSKPQYTEGYEGFYHLTDMAGEVGVAKLSYILREHCLEKLELMKTLFIKTADYINAKYPANTATVQIKDSYRNMAQIITTKPECVNHAITAMESLGIKPKTSPIRGGTDGARLTFMGLPTPNLGTGGYNCHGPYEFACLEEMEIVTKLLIEIAKIK